MKVFENIKDVDVKELDNGEIYIYVLKNEPQGNIKIGISKNMQQRLQSLSGSNSGGNRIVQVAVSNPTYLYSLETTAHTYFDRYRIKGTEWFKGKNVTFENAVAYIDYLFNKEEYSRCNELRKKYTLEKIEKDKEKALSMEEDTKDKKKKK